MGRSSSFESRPGIDGWLPNLASGVSVWKLAADLNAPTYFDGRLLIPDTEGPDNLPTQVEWNLTGLVPLAIAKTRHPDAAASAIGDFLACLERAGALFDEDGYEDFASAFTVPGLDADDGAHYFYHPKSRKLYVVNWGARPRSIAAQAAHVYDRFRFPELIAAERARTPGAMTADRGGNGGEEPKRRRWWIAAILLPVVVIAAGLLFLVVSDDAREEVEPEPDIVEPVALPEEPLTPPELEPEAPAPPIPTPHQKIYFDIGMHRLDEDQTTSLTAIRDYLMDNPRVSRLLIEGHADFQGAEHDNMGLSAQRARRVADWLEQEGIDRNRIETVGCSELYPEDESRSGSARRRNRRVEFYVLQPVPEGGLHQRDGCAP